MDYWHTKRAQRKIKIRRLFNRDPKSLDSFKKLKGKKLTKQRMMPEGSFTSALGVWVFGKRAVLWFVKEDPIGIVIENAEIAKGFREQFEYMWDQAGKTKKQRSKTSKTVKKKEKIEEEILPLYEKKSRRLTPIPDKPVKWLEGVGE